MTPRRPSSPVAAVLQNGLDAIWPFISGRRKFALIAGLMLVTGLALGWDWLTAIGAAPLILAVLPCAAMCALGLCMRRSDGGHSGGTRTGDVPPPAVDDGADREDER